MATDPTTLVVLQSFVGKVDGADVIFRAGDPVKPNHPAVKKWPHLFGDQKYRHAPIEQATAGPGERR